MPNIRTVINTHNNKITSDDKPPSAMRTCDCARNTICPMEGNCLSENTLYTGSVTSSLPKYGEKKYAGVSAPPWKKRFGNHKLSFNKRQYEKQCIRQRGMGHQRQRWRIPH